MSDPVVSPPPKKPIGIFAGTPIADKYPKPERFNNFKTAEEARLEAINHARKVNGFVGDTTGSPSMEPLIVGRHFGVNAPEPYEKLKEGDIVVYVDTDRFGRPLPGDPKILHRLVAKDKDGWIPSGDNNRRSENWMRVTPKNYKGKLIALYGYEGVENTRKVNQKGK